jgi:hypothetical protein
MQPKFISFLSNTGTYQNFPSIDAMGEEPEAQAKARELLKNSGNNCVKVRSWFSAGVITLHFVGDYVPVKPSKTNRTQYREFYGHDKMSHDSHGFNRGSASEDAQNRRGDDFNKNEGLSMGEALKQLTDELAAL